MSTPSSRPSTVYFTTERADGKGESERHERARDTTVSFLGARHGPTIWQRLFES